MKKIIFTLMLAIAGSVWTMSSALCIARAPQSLQQPTTLSGLLVMEGTPCESTDTLYPCLPCLTLAFQSNETLYYLTSDNEQTMSQLDEIEAQLNESQHATVTGILYQQGSYNYINVQNISLDSDPLPSLCDEWHMLVPGFSWPYKDYTYMHHLANDTLIGGQHYVQLESNETGTFAYEGAMRESESKVYYIPAGSTHEYLLYDFNVQVGDTLTNLWIGGQESEYEQGLIRDIIVEDIEGTAPSRKFYISFTYDYWQGMFRWIEGVGLNEGPAGWYYVPGTPVDPTPEILCAYKDGKRVYATSQAEQHSCCYNAQKINSLCDTWNVLEIDGVTCGGCEVYRTMKYCLTTDTIIGGTHYVKLMKGNAYEGALREGNNRDIYFIPSGSTHEYLLYAFNAQVNDMLDNLYIGETCPEGGYAALVEAISEGTPRVFTIRVLIPETKPGMESGATFITDWIEGVGYGTTPLGKHIGPLTPADSRGYSLLCAYMNGKQVYASDLSEQYGCEYNYDPHEIPTDTIPLFAQDDPGSSTVDPVDPNQVVATLQGDQLTIHEKTGVDVTYSLHHNAPAQTPSQHRAPQSDTFRNEVTIQITESGEYLLQLTNPSWGYTIVGRFTYVAEGIELTNDQLPMTIKVIKDGRLLIRRGEKIYTVTGQQIQ